MNKVILLDSRPEGSPEEKNFKIKEIETPEVGDGEVLLEAKWVSVDPYLRGRMRDEESYVPPFKLHEAITSAIVAQVVKSNHPDFEKGDMVRSEMAWQKLQTSNGKGLQKIDTQLAKPSAWLGVLGSNGITAYIGLEHIGKPQSGETMVVSGAAGAVGSVAGQIGKIKGCRVVGIAGTDKKGKKLKEEMGFDDFINYHSTGNMTKAIREACPDGVDVYFDNVGGEVSDGVMANINKFARVALCGAISLYNKKEVPTGPRKEPLLIQKSALMQGFIVRDYKDEFEQASRQLAKWLSEEKLVFEETIVEGFENIPSAFMGLFEGDNMGKMVVKV